MIMLIVIVYVNTVVLTKPADADICLLLPCFYVKVLSLCSSTLEISTVRRSRRVSTSSAEAPSVRKVSQLLDSLYSPVGLTQEGRFG